MAKFRRKTKTVEAVRLMHEMTIEQGFPGPGRPEPKVGHAGDWLVTDGDEQIFYTDELFQKLFEKDECDQIPTLPPYWPLTPPLPAWPNPQWPYDGIRPWDQWPIVYCGDISCGSGGITSTWTTGYQLGPWFDSSGNQMPSSFVFGGVFPGPGVQAVNGPFILRPTGIPVKLADNEFSPMTTGILFSGWEN